MSGLEIIGEIRAGVKILELLKVYLESQNAETCDR
jgi:hypothetical protein